MTTPVTMEALLSLRRPTEVVVSPDGRQVACSVLNAACTDPPAGAQANLWLASAGQAPRQLTRGPGQDALPRWSPDGSMLAFASDRAQAGLMSLHLLSPEIGEAAPVGDIAGSCEDLSWSADGQRLLVLAADPGSDRAGAQTATRIESRDAPPPDPKVTRPGQAWRRLYLVDVADGSTKQVGPPGENIWEFDWDGRSAAVAVVSGEPTESSWYDATLVLIDLEQRAVTARYQPRLQLSGPRLSPDASRVAFVEGVASDRATWPGGTPKCAQLVAGQLAPADISTDFEVSWLCWKDEGTLIYHSWEGLRSACGLLSLDGKVTSLWAGQETVGGRTAEPISSDAACTVLAAVRESTNEPPEVAVLAIGGPAIGGLAAGGPAGGWQQVTAFNAALKDLELPEWQEREWAAPDGIPVHGLLALPPGRKAAGLPLMVIVHGGPVSAWTHQWTNFGHPLLWTAAGYAVLQPNPRGSRGWGPEFAEAILGDMGGGELTDIVSGVDSLVSDGIVDTDRVGIFGASHGGYMTAWAITQTTRFAAAMPMACVSDWLSFHHTTNIGRFDELFVGADPYDAGGLYVQRSPIMHVRNVRTPTLIIHGALDLCTPVGQAEELYRGIADTGLAEVELAVYPREGHGLLERAHQLDFWERARAFFDRHLLG